MKNKRSFDFARAIYVSSRESPSGAVDLSWMLHNSWRSTIPLTPSNSGGTAAQLLRTILFQVSNKLCQALTEPYHNSYMTDRGEHLLVLFHELHKTHPMVLGQLLTWTDPTSEAIIESLYEDAVRYGDTALVSTLLDATKDANDLLNLKISQKVLQSNGKLHLSLDIHISTSTPLQWAASVCDVKLATVLLKAGAKPNIGNPAPLEILCSNTKADAADVLRFADLLIHFGALVDICTDGWLSPLMGAVLSENKDLVRFLLQSGATDVIKPATRYSETGMIHDLFLTEDYKFMFPETDRTIDSVSALQISMVVNNSTITDMLIHSVSSQEGGNKILEWALVTACVAGEEHLVKRLLAHLQAHFHDKISLSNEMILATAWNMDCRIARLLIDHSTVRRELQNLSLSLFQAAALHGNIPLINFLDSEGFDVNSGLALQFRLWDRKEYDLAKGQPPPLASTPMGCAVWMDHKDAIEVLLAIGADVAGIHLVCAVRSGPHNLVSRVLERCNNVDELWDGQRAIDVAIRYCRGMALIGKLIDAGAILHGHELVDAVRSDDREVVHFLLPKFDVLATNKGGENVLEAACCTGNLDLIRYYFICRGAYSSRAMLLAASRAAKTHDYHTVDYLVTTRPPGPIDDYEASALALSIRMEDSVLVNILISDQFGLSSALSIYCYCPRLGEWRRGIGEIKEHVYPLDYDNHSIGIGDLYKTDCTRGLKCYRRFSPVLVAALMGQGSLVRTMLNRGHLPDALLVRNGYESSDICQETRDMILTAYSSRIPLIKDQEWNERLLTVTLKHNADTKIVQEHLNNLTSLEFWHWDYGAPSTNDRSSPLEWAVRSDRLELVELFLKAGANPKGQDPERPDYDAFTLAIIRGNLAIASLLLDKGADINTLECAALSFATIRGDLRAMTFLLQRGADLNSPGTSAGPLQLAANLGMIDAVELLLTAGVDIYGRRRIHFIRAVRYATERCHYALAKLLKERGGWTKQDQDISKTPRAAQYGHADNCARFLYDDPSLEPCELCPVESKTPSSPSSDDECIISDPIGLVAITEQLEDQEVGPLTDELLILELEPDIIEHGRITESFDWPLVPYGPQDRELDNIVQGLLLEDGMIIDME
ncbi:hypothetical protein PFICI_03973 [Pestalotiopsis fici W106-1]|uniref:Ankyrin n=1 Tax=Pestalotiopsis fici (strain W106-1 / CGMCC3.15140) TaxID=1229662 RepID=W3XIQ1_PESFW|nr:uncharacterized protein PFICI_03973 [Pestalotiopsis fici W106-1]ETS85948.1 hypothetical protein PFICI_03973 [Pestalotiopsis fici W106-1]